MLTFNLYDYICVQICGQQIYLSLSPRRDSFKKRSKTFTVGLLQTVCAFVCGLSVEEIIVFVLLSKDDAWYKSTIFFLTCADVHTCACAETIRRAAKRRMRFKAQKAICDWTQTKMKGNFKLGLPLGYAQVITFSQSEKLWELSPKTNWLQRWLYWREHNHKRDLHTTETTDNERLPIGQITFVLFWDIICLIRNLKHRCAPRSVLRTASRTSFDFRKKNF